MVFIPLWYSFNTQQHRFCNKKESPTRRNLGQERISDNLSGILSCARSCTFGAVVHALQLLLHVTLRDNGRLGLRDRRLDAVNRRFLQAQVRAARFRIHGCVSGEGECQRHHGILLVTTIPTAHSRKTTHRRRSFHRRRRRGKQLPCLARWRRRRLLLLGRARATCQQRTDSTGGRGWCRVREPWR